MPKQSTPELAASSQEPQLSALGLELLMSAVRLARAHQIASVQALRLRLSGMYPQAQESDIEQALTYWANHAQRNRALA